MTATVMGRHAKQLPDGTYGFEETGELIQEACQALELLASVQRATEGDLQADDGREGESG